MKKQVISIIIVVAIALALITAMLLFYFLGVKGSANDNGAKTVTLEILYNGKEYRYEDLVTTSSTIGELIDTYQVELELGAKWDSGIYGRFITELKNTPQNVEDGIYYTYELNGDFALGVDEQDIKDGDVVTFKYGKTQYDQSWNVVGYTLSSGGDDTSTSTPTSPMTIAFVAILIASIVVLSVVVLVIIYKNERKKAQN